jgi:hypothetical protein
MVVRTYGVRNGAGVQVTEEEVRGPVQASAFGTAAFVGKLERGAPGTVIQMFGPKQAQRKIGGRIDGSLVRDGVDDFWEHSDGTGLALAVRVTDGAEVPAAVTLYSGHTGFGQHVASVFKPDSDRPSVPVLKVEAKDGGRWGGRSRDLHVLGVVVGGNLTETTVDTGLAMLEDEYVGGYVVLYGVHANSGKLYEIVANDDAGVVTVKGDSTMLADVSSVTQVSIDVRVYLPTSLLGGGVKKGLAVVVKPGGTDPVGEFGLDVYLDGEKVRGWETLSMDPTSGFYAPSVINEDDANDEVVVTDLLTAGTTYNTHVRPSNFTRYIKAETATTLSFNAVQVAQNDEPANVKLVGYALPSNPMLTGKMVFTWDASDDKWTVDFVESVFGGVEVTPLPIAGTISAPAYNVTYDSGFDRLPTITFDLVGTPTVGSQFVVHCLPLPDASGGVVYPDEVTNRFTGFVIRENTDEQLTVESGDPSLFATQGAAANVPSLTLNEPYNITLDTNDKLRLRVDDRTWVDIQLTANAAKTAAEIVSEVNAAFDAVFGATVLNPASVQTDITGSRPFFQSPGGFDGTGAGSSVEADNSIVESAYVTLGFPAMGVGGTGVWRGTEGSKARVEYLQPLVNGYDGLDADLQDYLDVFSALDSPFNQIIESGFGNVMISTTGLSKLLNEGDLVLVYKQAFQFCEGKPYLFFGETPLDKSDPADMLSFWKDTVGRSDMAATFVPSYANIVDPDASAKRKEVSTMPMVMGLWALYATTNQGYHLPAAGEDAVLHRIVSLPEGWTELNEDVLTPAGLNVIKKRKANFRVWGARTLFENDQWKQLSVRLQMNHYVWTFLDAYDWVIFKLNDRFTRALVVATTTAYLRDEWAKRVLAGESEADAFTVKSDGDNNPQSEIDAGNAHLDMKLCFNKFIERLKVSVGPKGVTETA